MCVQEARPALHGLPTFPRVPKLFLLPPQQSSGPDLEHTWAAEPVQHTPVPRKPFSPAPICPQPTSGSAHLSPGYSSSGGPTH